MTGVGDYLRRVEEIADIVRADAVEADRNRRLGDKTVGAMVDAGLHRIQVPESLGGGGLTWGESCRVFEAMGRVDGAAGWNLSIWAGAATMAVVLASTAARVEVLADDALSCASLNFMNITARRVNGGFRFDGKATYLSGSSHATWVSLGGWLHDEAGKPQLDSNGPVVVRAIAPLASVTLEDTWHVGGMRATASNDATLDGLFVPDGFVSDPALGWARPDEAANHIPVQSRFGQPFAWVGLGVARAALDALDEVAGRVPLASRSSMRERTDVQIEVSRARGLVESGRAFLTSAWDGVIAKVERGERVTPEDRALLRLSYVTAVEHAATATDLVRRVAGSAGLYESDRIERCWRDAHAIGVQVMVSPRNHERTGRVFLGLDPLPGIL